jgi:outer membrane lipoprotein-sorting protein
VFRRAYLVVAIAATVMVVLGVGLAVAQERSGPDLPALTPAELMSRVAERAPETRAVNGDFSWSNDLLGGGAVQLPGGTPGLTAFLKDGAGRLWLQKEGGRLEAQTPRGDTLVVSDGEKVWFYSSNESTVAEYSLEGHDKDNMTTDTTPPLDLSARIQSMIEKMAPTASLEVGTARVAGRDAYLLVMTPTADNTVFGSAQVAFDAEHFLPLRVEVFAKSGEDPVLSAGFSRVSFDPVDASLFTFSPPAGTTVEKKEIEVPKNMLDHGKRAEADKGAKRPLSLEEAQAQAGFDLALPENPPLPFAGARVLPGHGEGSPVVVLTYGEGFGTVAVVQTELSEEQLREFLQGMSPAALAPGAMPGAFQGEVAEEGSPEGVTSNTQPQVPELMAAVGTLLEPTRVNGRPAFQVGTRLGSAIAWQQDGLGVLVAGSVPPADLTAFAALFR